MVAVPIGQAPEEHTHLDGDQWFAVLHGELDWDVAGQETVRARPGDLLYVPAGTGHKLTPRGSEDTLRLSCTASQGFRIKDADGLGALTGLRPEQGPRLPGLDSPIVPSFSTKDT